MKTLQKTKMDISQTGKRVFLVIVCVFLAMAASGCQKQKKSVNQNRQVPVQSSEMTPTPSSNNTTATAQPSTTDASGTNGVAKRQQPTAASPVKDFPCVDNADNTVTITNYAGSGGAVIIPAEINGKPVTSIGDSAFSFSKAYAKITTVSIPDGVTSIAGDAFNGCSGLTIVTIPASVVEFSGNRTFEGCSSLKAIYFKGNAPTIMGDNQFKGTASDFATYHHKGSSGWEEYNADGSLVNTWQGCPAKIY